MDFIMTYSLLLQLNQSYVNYLLAYCYVQTMQWKIFYGSFSSIKLFVLFSDYSLCYFYLFLGFVIKEFCRMGGLFWMHSQSQFIITAGLLLPYCYIGSLVNKVKTFNSLELLFVPDCLKKFHAAWYVFLKSISNLGHRSTLESGCS